MCRSLAIAAALVVSAALWAAPAPPNNSIDLTLDKGLPTLLLGKSAEELIARFPESSERYQISTEGDPLDALTLQIEGAFFTLHLNNSKVEGFETEDASLQTINGAGVGSTVRELRKLYPSGHLSHGVEDGAYFAYRVKIPKGTISFQLDQSKFTLEQLHGPDLSLKDKTVLDTKVVSLWISGL